MSQNKIFLRIAPAKEEYRPYSPPNKRDQFKIMFIISPGDSFTVELWSLELACLEHQGSLELVRRSRQFAYTFNVKLHPRLEQRWLELSNSKHGPQGDFSCNKKYL